MLVRRQLFKLRMLAANIIALSLSTTPSSVRLDKYLNDAGFSESRSCAAAMIRSGRVRIDGSVVRSGKIKVDTLKSLVEVDGRRVVEPSIPLMMAYHKPLGVHSTLRDDHGRPDLSTVLDSMPMHWRRLLHPVGRLDSDTTGLLLFSSRGDLTHRLLHPRHAVEKEYTADCELRHDVNVDYIRSALAAGVQTSTGVHVAKLVEAIPRDLALLRLRLVVFEGKHRMVRRMLHNVGAPVLRLRRDRFGPVLLEDIPVGETRDISLDVNVKLWADSLLREAGEPKAVPHSNVESI